MIDKSRGQDPGDDVALAFDMDFGEDAAKGGRRPEQTFGAEPDDRGSRSAAPPPPAQDDYDEFETMPEPGQNFGASSSPARDDFEEFGAGRETHASTDFGDDHPQQGFGHGDPVEDFDAATVDDEQFGTDDGFSDPHTAAHDENLEDDEEAVLRADHDDEDSEIAPEVAGRSLMSRVLVPAVAVGGIAVLGWLGWSYVSPFFFDQAPVQQAQVQQPRIQVPPQATMPPQPGQLPPFPSAGQARPTAPQQAQQQPGLAPLQPPAQQPQRPLQQTAAPAPSAQPVARPQAQQTPVAAAQASPSAEQTAQVPTGMNRPDADAMAKIFGAIAQVSNDVRGLGVRMDGIEKGGNDMRSELGRRMDEIDTRARGGVQVASAAPGVSLAPKASASTTAPSLVKAPVKPAPVATRTARETAEEDSPPRAERSAKRVRHAKVERRRTEDSDPEDRASAGDEPPAKPRVIGGYRLKGVSEVGGRSIALVRTSRGLEEFVVGQTLAGGGEIRSIRQNGGAWVVVTSRGVIVE
jgi:hypothetical protein